MKNNLLNNRQIMQIKNTWDKESIRKTIDGGKHILWVIALSVCLLILQGFADLKIETGNQALDMGLVLLQTQGVAFLYNLVRQYAKGQNMNIDKVINDK